MLRALLLTLFTRRLMVCVPCVAWANKQTASIPKTTVQTCSSANDTIGSSGNSHRACSRRHHYAAESKLKQTENV